MARDGRDGAEPTLRIEVRVPNEAVAELAAAEAWEAGALGVEERSGSGSLASSGGTTVLVLYANAGAAASVREAVAAVAGAVPGVPEPVEEQDWSEAWREGLDAIRVGERLVVRPSWIEPVQPPPDCEIVIDPGQAFGTGAHVSTRLVLDWVEALSGAPGGIASGARLLDVGTGSGVLALAALGLGAGAAVGFDLDRESGVAARQAARANGLGDRLALFVGPIEAVAGPPFDWVLANLLKREVLPIAREIARCTAPGGGLVLSGLLAHEEDEVVAAFADVGFEREDARYAQDPNGDDWVSPRLRRAG